MAQRFIGISVTPVHRYLTLFGPMPHRCKSFEFSTDPFFTAWFTALGIATGGLITLCNARHRHHEFLSLLRHIEENRPQYLDVHLILDNYGTHARAKAGWRVARNFLCIAHLPTRPGSARFALYADR
jgi:hypothetical protein